MRPAGWIGMIFRAVGSILGRSWEGKATGEVLGRRGRIVSVRCYCMQHTYRFVPLPRIHLTVPPSITIATTPVAKNRISGWGSLGEGKRQGKRDVLVPSGGQEGCESAWWRGLLNDNEEKRCWGGGQEDRGSIHNFALDLIASGGGQKHLEIYPGFPKTPESRGLPVSQSVNMSDFFERRPTTSRTYKDLNDTI
eukprot:519858-Amorphochlora_amoeboformis.AAC.1